MDAVGSGDRVRWGDVLLGSIAAVSWALLGMAGAAALGLHLLGADAAGALGPMTAAVVVLAVGGTVTPTGDVSAFGLEGAQARTAVDITPLGVGLIGALFLAYFFLRSLRGAGPCISAIELAARVGGVLTLFVAMVGGLAWAGHDVITIDGAALGLDDVGGGGGGGGIEVPGLGDIGGLLPDRLGDLVEAEAAVGFSVNTADSLAGALLWVLGVMVIALLASRRTPLPRGAVWETLRRTVRPAASAMVSVLLVAVLAGYAAAAYAAIGDDHPKRIAGAALLGAPNGVWLGIPLGLFVPWDGEAKGEPAKLLPDPLDELLRVSADEPVTVGGLAELDQRVWLLAIATAVAMLYAGVLTASRTQLDGRGAFGFAGRCAVRLGVVTALTLPLLVWLTDVSADASLSVLGIDAVDAGIELHGQVGMALLLGAAWGAGAGGVGALLVHLVSRAEAAVPGTVPASAPASASASASGPARAPDAVRDPGPYRPTAPYRPPNPDTNPYLRMPPDIHSAPTMAGPLPPSPPREHPEDAESPEPPEEGPPPPGVPGGGRR